MDVGYAVSVRAGQGVFCGDATSVLSDVGGVAYCTSVDDIHRVNTN